MIFFSNKYIKETKGLQFWKEAPQTSLTTMINRAIGIFKPKDKEKLKQYNNLMGLIE